MKKGIRIKIDKLKKCEKLCYDAYILLNRASCILNEMYKIDFDDKYETNEFYLVNKITPQNHVYKQEKAIRELIHKLKTQK